MHGYHVERLGCDAVVGKQLEGVRPELGGDLKGFGLENKIYIRDQINRTLGITTVKHLTIKATKSLFMRVPPISLQNEFANFIHQVDKSKVAVQKSLDETQKLYDSLMQEYFG